MKKHTAQHRPHRPSPETDSQPHKSSDEFSTKWPNPLFLLELDAAAKKSIVRLVFPPSAKKKNQSYRAFSFFIPLCVTQTVFNIEILTKIHLLAPISTAQPRLQQFTCLCPILFYTVVGKAWNGNPRPVHAAVCWRNRWTTTSNVITPFSFFYFFFPQLARYFLTRVLVKGKKKPAAKKKITE